MYDLQLVYMCRQGSDFEKSLDDNLRYSINCINTVGKKQSITL